MSALRIRLHQENIALQVQQDSVALQVVSRRELVAMQDGSTISTAGPAVVLRLLSGLVGAQGPAGPAGAAGTVITVGTTPPESPVVNQLWLDTN